MCTFLCLLTESFQDITTCTNLTLLKLFFSIEFDKLSGFHSTKLLGLHFREIESKLLQLKMY